MVGAWTYERRRERINEIQREQIRSAQEIGTIPPVLDAERRSQADESFEFFCRTYFPAAFTLPWSEYHRRAASKVERAAGGGGMFAFAMPRGSGKTTICEWAALWAMLTGRCTYTVLVGATAPSALRRLQSIRTELQTNQLLAEDFPEVCYPIAALERSVRRADGQKHNGRPTAIGWTKEMLILPTVELQPGEAYLAPDGVAEMAPTSGAIVEVRGITGEIRGMNHKREDGSIIRPQLAICDDPQTRESAKSVSQCNDRESVIAGDVAYLAGPDAPRPIAVVMPCTVVYSGDLADRMLDREKHPEWQGERTKMVASFPTNRQLWDRYGEILRDSLRNDGDYGPANEFYAANREAMDAGCVVTWKERFDKGELSAVQHAMNKFIRDEASFMSEYQNEPIPAASDIPELSDEEIAARKTGLARGVCPVKSQRITAFIDVQKDLLYYAVIAWEDHFTGHVIEYGSYPEQGLRYWTAANVRHTLAESYPGAGLEGSIYNGLDALTKRLLGSKYQREDGTDLQIERCLIDANWGQTTGVVYRICSASQYSARLLPAHGKYVGASSAPWAEYRPKRGEKIGHHWRLGPSQTNPGIRRVLTDTNFWKSFVHARLAAPLGDYGALSLHEGNHRMFAEHMNAEYRVRTKGRGREVDEWKARPERPDNHLFDCVVGCCVGASIGGVTLMGTISEGAPQREVRKRVKLSEIQAEKRKRRR